MGAVFGVRANLDFPKYYWCSGSVVSTVANADIAYPKRVLIRNAKASGPHSEAIETGYVCIVQKVTLDSGTAQLTGVEGICICEFAASEIVKLICTMHNSVSIDS